MGSDVPPPCYMSHPFAAGSVGWGVYSSQATAGGFCSFVIPNFVTKGTQSLNSFIPHLYLYQRGSISGSLFFPLPVSLSSFRNLPPLLRYDFSFILAFHTSELTDSTADGTKKEEKQVYSSGFHFFFADSHVRQDLVPLRTFPGRMDAILLGWLTVYFRN